MDFLAGFSVVNKEKTVLGQAGWPSASVRGMWPSGSEGMVEEGSIVVNAWSPGGIAGRDRTKLCVGTHLYRGILIGEINHLSLGLEELPTWRRVWEERLGLHWMVARSIRCASTICGSDVTVACLPSKQSVRVRFPSVAPFIINLRKGDYMNTK